MEGREGKNRLEGGREEGEERGRKDGSDRGRELG